MIHFIKNLFFYEKILFGAKIFGGIIKGGDNRGEKKDDT